MPLCITCSYPLPHLYTIYSKADDRTLGKGVRLTQCPNCKRFADKYVEHDYVVLFIDLVLIKPQVYRHLLFNRLSTSVPSKDGSKDRLDPSILRLGTLLVLFDVYITWARIEKGSTSPTNGTKSSVSVLTSWPIVGQYLFFLTLNIASTLAQHFTIRNLAYYFVRPSPTSHQVQWSNHSRTSSSVTPTAMSMSKDPGQGHSRHTSQDVTSPVATTAHGIEGISDPNTPRPGRATPSAISTALLVSSCTKLFPILLVIWPTTTTNPDQTTAVSSSGPFASRAASYISWVVLINNIEALLILLDCGYAITTGLAIAGMVARYVVEGWLLGLVGLQRDGSGPIGDFVGLLKWVSEGLKNAS